MGHDHLTRFDLARSWSFSFHSSQDISCYMSDQANCFNASLMEAYQPTAFHTDKMQEATAQINHILGTMQETYPDKHLAFIVVDNQLLLALVDMVDESPSQSASREIRRRIKQSESR